jgi:MFS superfamily sulfate permease-like transporter
MNVMSKIDDIAKRPHSLTPLNEDRRMRYYPIVRNWSRIHRMLQTTALETHVPLVAKDDVPDDESREAYDETSGQGPSVVVYRISGALFFSAAASIGTVLERIGDAHRNLIIDFAAVPFVDSTGAKTDGRQDHRGSGAHKAAQRGVGVSLTGASAGVGSSPRKASARRWSTTLFRSTRRWLKFAA